MKYIFTLIVAFFAFSINAQHEASDLPRGFSEKEIQLIESGEAFRHVEPSFTGAPDGPVRTMAEWEELEGVVITWRSYYGILGQIVNALKDDTKVYIVCNDSIVVQNVLNSQGVSYESNVYFFELPSNSVWVRDYGPNSAYLNDTEELVFIDWIYNRPRPKDDNVPFGLAETLGIPIYSTDTPPQDMVNTGGNFMADGMGAAFSSELVLDENDAPNQWGFSDHSEEDIDAIMKDFMGLDEYIKMENLPYDAIHHIDMHMKLLDEETLIVGEYPEGVADGPQIEANIAYVLENFKTPYGNDYHVVRVPMPPDFWGDYPDTNWADYRTYANALIANKTILIPTYEEKYDTTGLRIWEETMPGYTIVPINCNDMISASGAIHCITKEVGVSNPILINMPHVRSVCADEGTEIRASIKHTDGINASNLYYKTNLDDEYTMLPMTMEADNVHWNATIPGYPLGTKVYYYVEAEGESGKKINRPIVAPEGYWSYDVNCSVSVQELLPAEAAISKVFPNPASALTCVELETQSSFYGELQLFNIHGQMQSTIHEGLFDIGTKKYFFNASSLVPGTYFIRFTTEKGSLVKKIMIE